MISFYYAQGWIAVQATELAQHFTFRNYFFLYLSYGGFVCRVALADFRLTASHHPKYAKSFDGISKYL